MRKVLRKILISNKGMSLVELIIGMFIFSVVVTSAIAIMVPILRTMARANQLAEVNPLLDNIANQIIRDLSASTLAPIYDDNELFITIDGSDSVEFTIEDDILIRNGDAVLPSQFYKGNALSFTVDEKEDEDNEIGLVYELTIILTDTTGAVFSRTYDVRPLVLNPYN